MRVASYITSP